MGGSYDLQGILRNLRSNKITDRKKAFSALKGALQSPSTLASLDRNTLGKVNLTWDIIAANVIKAVDQELEKFAENAKKNKTSTTAEADLRSVAGLLRTVVQSANRKQPLLNARKVLEHIREVLVDEGNPGAALVHPQYTRLLLLLLGSNGWQPVLVAGVYNDLVDLVCGLLRQEDADEVGLSSTLHHLVSTGFHQEDGRLETVFRTLATSFIKTRENVTVSKVVQQLATLVEVGRRLGGRRRHLLCSIGEPVARFLLVPFNWKSLQIKELSLEFLSLQLGLHRTEEEAEEEGEEGGHHGSSWEGLLADWHQLLMRQLQERPIGSTTSGQQEARVRKAQVWLATETWHQLERRNALASAVAALLPLKPNQDALPWLEVLACYLWRYPETAKHASSSLRKLLDFLTQCYSSCKLQGVKRCIMLCYCSVARAHGPQCGTNPWPVWSLVWDQTVKTVFLNQCVEEGHLVLQELLRRGWACSDCTSLFCPGGGRSMELAALHSVAALLGSAGSMPHLDVPSMALLDSGPGEEDVPEKHRWRLWLLELLVPGEGLPPRAATLVPAGELLAALCLARPSIALAPSAWQPLLAWQDPYPWRSKLDADVERRSRAQLLLCQEEAAKNDGTPTATAAVMELAWNAALDTLAKQCSAFLDAEDMLPACLYTACMGVILVARIWCLQGGEEELLASPLVKQLQGHLRECAEKLLQCSPPLGRQPSGGGEQEQPPWLGFLDALLSYVEGIPSGHHLWAWLLDALPQELDACLISTFREPSSDISATFGPRTSGMGEHIDIGSDDDEWVDENTPSSSLLHRGSVDGVGDMDADFDFVDGSQPASTEAATKQSLVSLERLTREDGQCLATLRLGLSHFCLSRRVGLGDGERTFAMLLQLAEGAKRNLTPWSIQAALLVFRVLFERAELMVESELFSLVDALRELIKVHYRQLDVSAALLDLARLCVPAVSRCEAQSKPRGCFLVILEAYALLQGSDSATQGVCNEGVSLAFLRLLLECSQESWVVLKVDKGGPVVPALKYAVRFLGSGHDSVRTLAAQSVGLFLRDPGSLDALLPHLAKHLKDVEVSREDEHLAACLVFATALGNAGIALGPHLGARAAALLVHAVWDKHLPASLVAKVLAQWKSAQPWSHLPTVVHHWLKQGLPLRDLPFEALGGEAGEARQFLERHWQLVLPAAVECCSQEAVQFVGDTLGRPARSLLAEVAPVALSRALPFGGDSAPPPALRFLETCLSREAVQQVMMERLPEVLVSVLQLACDWPDTHGGLTQRLYPPCLGDAPVKETLRLLETKCSEDASLVDILLRRRDGLQLVLEGLEGSSLAALRHLVDLVAPYLSRAAGLRGSDCYVLRTLTLRLLRRLPAERSRAKAKGGITISAEENRVVCLVARLLRRLYEAAGEHLYKEIERNLPVVVNALAPFVDENNVALAWEVQALVKVLVSDERLETAVLCVRPLPDVDLLVSSQGSLQALRTRVRQGNFAQVLSALTRSLRETLLSEDTCVLAALGDLLKQHRAELNGLLEGIQGKTFFSEETTSSPLHQLIVILFERTRSPDEEVRAASLRCLGLLGPVELGLPTLGTAHWNPMAGMVDDVGQGCSEAAYRLLLGRVHRYLCHADPQLSAVACRALKCALSTRSGVAFASRHGMADMEDVFAFLHPFCSVKVCLLERPPGPADAEPWELWAPEGPCDHATWVGNLVCTLIRCTEDHFFWALLPLCELETELCELLFPFVVETLADERTHWNAVVSGVAIFLERHAENRPRDDGQSQSTVTSEPLSTESAVSRVYCSRASVTVIMSAVERMLVRRQARASTLWDGLRLQVDLLKAAQAAEFCGNHVTAVQCVELWWDWQGRARESLSDTEDSGAPLLHWSGGGREAPTVQSVLLSSFSGLGDLDALTGCRCLALGGSARLLWRHCAEQRGGHWPTLLAQADLEAVGRNARLGHALKQCGLYHTLATYLQGTESPDLAELQAECAWRLADWDCRLPTGSDDTGFQRGIFTTLSSISSREAEGLRSGLSTCRQLLSGQLLAMAQLGSAQELNQLLSKVQMCTVLEEGVALAMGEEEEAVLLKRWEERAAQPGFDFREPVSWLQGVLVGQLGGSPQARAAHTAILSHYAVQARLNQYPWLARVSLKELERCAPEQGERWKLEEARIQLAQGDCTEAQHTLYTLLTQLGHPEGTSSQDSRAYAEVLQLYGEYLAESRSENSDTIAREYFAKAVELLAGHTAEASLWTAHLRLARFADAQVQRIEQYLQSPEFRAKQDLLRQSSHILHCTPVTPALGGDARALRLLERQSDLDRGEAASLEAARGRHLLQAVSNYLHCLRGGHDLRLFRLASLWFGNPEVPEVNALLKDGLGKLESYKFVPLIYQLAARMSRSGNESPFAKLLSQLIERVVRDHPYQTLPVVLALCNADKDPNEKGAAPRTKKARTSLPSEDRVEGARSLVSRLRKGSGLCSAILPQLERLMDAYIHLAYLDPPSAPRGQPIACVKLPRDTPLLKLGQVDKVPVLTQDVLVDRSASYSGLPGILKFSPEYRLCGGINMPKVVTCMGQDGRSYKQLVKGRDDLRQDAVMQQAFGLVNLLLDQEKKGRTGGRLAMRTYKVVPLSRRSGLVQWCEGTQPFSEFLLTNTGAHQRYQPNDWAPLACRKAMQAVHKSSPEERLQAYLEVCSHFHPVFRYFFFEHFPEPSRWFERRRAYVHSVATGSIVGYILGLGDRHCANILVDKHSAELIHIDLGVAFEQGRTLNTPETVPFRLTRDVVDGMGICGVEGTFRRCCERTMEVMRSSRELLVTVVEVLLHDPLSSWTLSPERAAALQADGSGDDRRRSPTQEVAAPQQQPQHDQKNRLACRMLLRLEQKLQGLEEGCAPLSVAGQVNLLIQQAIDPHNLSRLFPGWQPYV